MLMGCVGFLAGMKKPVKSHRHLNCHLSKPYLRRKEKKKNLKCRFHRKHQDSVGGREVMVKHSLCFVGF